MRILVEGARGTIGKAVTTLFRNHGHTVIEVGRSDGEILCDISDETQLESLWQQAGHIDAVVCASGTTPFAPLGELAPADFNNAWQDKALSQISLVRTGINHISERGSFTLTSRILSRDPILKGSAAAAANGALEAFTRAAAIEIAPRRVNIVSPPVVAESLEAYDEFFPGFPAVKTADVANAFRKSVEGGATGTVITLP